MAQHELFVTADKRGLIRENIFFQEMERVWCQYERMESELSVIRSHLQHICNFGVPQVFVRHTVDTF